MPAPTAPSAGGAEHGRVGAGGVHAHADRVGLELEQQRLVGEAAVHAQRATSTLSRMAATTSATRQAMPSSAARATCARVVPPCIPASTARASGRHHGAPRPARPGSTRAPAVVLGLARQLGERGRALGHAELAAHPLEHRPGGEHAAVDRVLRAAVDAPGDGGQQAARWARAPRRPRGRARTRRCRRWPSRGPAPRSRRPPAPPAGPPPGRTAAAPPARTRGAARPSSPAVSRTSGSTSSGTPNSSHSRASKPGVPSGCSCVREAVELSVAKPAPSRSHRNESTVPIRSVPASRARCTASSCSSSQASLAAEK